MILSQAAYDAAVALVEGEDPLPELTRKRILNSSVELMGTGLNGDLFYGSGVIVNANPTRVTVLTALHNVAKWAKDAEGWTDMLDEFAASIYINFAPDKKDMTFNGTVPRRAKLATATTIHESNDPSNYYDLLVLTSNDFEFKKYAGASVFDGVENTLPREAALITQTYQSLLNIKWFHHVQCGYGKTYDTRSAEKIDYKTRKIVKGRAVTKRKEQTVNMQEDKLHYRVTSPLTRNPPRDYYLQQANEGERPRYLVCQSAHAFTARDRNTTGVGDSGGPIWAIDKGSRTHVYLIGVTTGVDMLPSPKPAEQIFRTAIVTSTLPFMTQVKL